MHQHKNRDIELAYNPGLHFMVKTLALYKKWTSRIDVNMRIMLRTF